MGTINILNIDAYRIISNSFDGIILGDRDLVNLDTERLKLLLINDFLPFDESNISIFKKTEIYVDYLLFHYKQFYERRKSSYFTNSDVAEHILSFDEFSLSQRRELLMLVPKDILLKSGKLADIVLDILIQCNDVRILDEEVVLKLLENSNMLERKVQIASALIMEFDYDYDESMIADVLDIIGGCYKEIAARTKHPQIKATEWNRSLVDILEKKEFISSHRDENGMIRIYPKRVK